MASSLTARRPPENKRTSSVFRGEVMVGLICVNKLSGRAAAGSEYDDDQFERRQSPNRLPFHQLAVRAEGAMPVVGSMISAGAINRHIPPAFQRIPALPA